MPRLNRVQLFGILAKDPEYTDEDRSEIKVTVQTTIGKRFSPESGEYEDKYEYIRVLSNDPKLVPEIESWKKNDFVLVNGIFSTRNVEAVAWCWSCGAETPITETMEYVLPDFVQCVAHPQEEETEEWLRKYAYLSNKAEFLGCLGNDPEYVEVTTRKGRPVNFCQYQLILNRTFHIGSGQNDKKTDAVYVKSYNNASEDATRLQKGSCVFIDGYLQTRQFRKKIRCPECNLMFRKPSKTIEIVPYFTEYLEGYRAGKERTFLEHQEEDA